MYSQKSNSKTMDFHQLIMVLHLQVPKFENHFILPNSSKNKLLFKDVTSITKPNLVDYYYEPTHPFNSSLYLFITVNLCALDYNN